MNPESYFTPTYNAGFQQYPTRQQRGHIKWNQSGISSSAGRRLPFVHRFHGLPPPAGLSNDRLSPALPTKSKMSSYETNPVGALQERFQSRRLIPVFDLIQSEGASHCPIFTYKVSVCEKSATGSGNSKKQAKHAAAKAMMNLLDGVEGQSGNGSSVAAPAQTEEVTASTLNAESDAVAPDQPGSNPIGELQEFCVKNGLPIPIYDLGSTDGQPHKRHFLMVAKVGAAETSGSGTSKKEAKKIAAAGMLERLTSAGTEGAKVIVFTGNSVNSGNKNGLGSDLELSDMRIEPMTMKHSKVMQQFFKNLEVQSGKLHNLQHTSLLNRNANYAATLMALASELKFEVKFIDIDEPTLDGESQCLVQLTTLPVAVCFGVGIDNASAKNDAARNAFYYLRIMTKKSLDESPSTATPDSKSSARSVTLKK